MQSEHSYIGSGMGFGKKTRSSAGAVVAPAASEVGMVEDAANGRTRANDWNLGAEEHVRGESAPSLRKVTRDYLEKHKLQQVLAEAVQQALRERAPNCPHRVAHLLLNASYNPTVAASSTGAPALSTDRVEWRAKMVRDMAVGMELEIRTNLAGSMLEAERCETFRALMAANALSRGDSWFSDDDNFSSALKAAVTLKQEIVRPDTVLSMIGSLPPPTREKAVAFVVRFLDSPDAALRRAATELLGGHTHYGVTVSRGKHAMPCMPSAVLAPHADAIVRRLDDADLHVRHPNPNPNTLTLTLTP